MKLCVTAALKAKVSLRGADLRGADLSGADLSDAGMSGAVLSDAGMSGAVLRGADLSDAVLRGADLRGADLRGADLRGADLSGADLTPIRDDYWLVLLNAPAEIPSLREALVDGKVDGSTYEGECACLVGTIANAKKCDYGSIPNIMPNSSRPIERFFCGIKRGDTPKNNQFSNLAVQWLDEFVELQRASAGLFLAKK